MPEGSWTLQGRNQGRREFPENNLPPPSPPPPVDNFLGKKLFPDEYVAIAFQGLYLNFSYQISVLSPKNRYLALLAAKMTGAQQKISRGPSTSWQFAPLPTPLGGPGRDCQRGSLPKFFRSRGA